MTLTGWITMIFVIGLVWGGFAILLPYAIRMERKKGGDEEFPETYPTP
jgi:hypothetical protein